MQAGWRYFQIEIVAQPFLELFDKEEAPLSIEFADPFHMAEEKSFCDETRQRSLINRWRVLVHDSAHLDQSVNKLWRCDQKNEAQRWIEDLAHTGGIKNPPGNFQTFKTTQQRAHENNNHPPGCSRRATPRTR